MNQHQRERQRKFAALLNMDAPQQPRRRKHRTIPIAPVAVNADISNVWVHHPYGTRNRVN